MGHGPIHKREPKPTLLLRDHSVLATVSRGYSQLKGTFPCITHPCATLLIPKNFLVRLACVKHAASVRSEPGSNSNVLNLTESTILYFARYSLLPDCLLIKIDVLSLSIAIQFSKSFRHHTGFPKRFRADVNKRYTEFRFYCQRIWRDYFDIFKNLF